MEFDPQPEQPSLFTPGPRDWQAAHIVQSGSLTYQQVQVRSTGLLYSRYHLWVKDNTANRMVPHHLGETERSCDHLACELVLANSFAAGYSVQQGWHNDHANRMAYDLLRKGGVDI